MIVDKYLQLSDAQEVLESAASESHIDAVAAGDAVAPGARLKVQVHTLFEGAYTLIIALQCDTTTDFSSGSVRTLHTSETYAVAALVAKAVLVDIQIPPNLVERYIRLYYTTSGTFTAGRLDANIALDTNKTMDKQL